MVDRIVNLQAWEQNDVNLRIVQGEQDSRRLIFRLLNNQEPVKLSGCAVTLYCEKPDTTVAYRTVEIQSADEGIVQFVVPDQLAAVPGECDCWLQVIGTGGNDLRFSGVTLTVAECALTGAVTSADDFKAFQDAMATAAATKKEVADARGTFGSLKDRQDWQDVTIAARGAGYVTPEQFGAKGDGIADDTEAIQTAIDNSQGFVALTAGKVYRVRKNTALPGYPNGDQPCLEIRGKKNFIFDGNGATIHVDEHGQGMMDITDSENVLVHNLNITGHGSFPAIDSASGRGEKGIDGEGYYRANGWFQWDYYRNNSLDTTQYEGFGSNPNAVWGEFGNGFIGNCGTGITLRHSSDVILDNCDISGFNYAGVYVGYGSDELSCKHCIVNECHCHDIYNSGIELRRAEDCIVQNCRIERIGHPDAIRADVAQKYKYQVADPGYGITASVGYPNKVYTAPRSIMVQGNTIRDCVRKGIDSHSCAHLTVDGNYVYNANASGIEIASYQDEPGRFSPCPTIVNNTVIHCGEKGKGIFLHGVDLEGQTATNFRQVPHNASCCNNHIIDCSNALASTLMGGSTITGNVISGSQFNDAGDIPFSLVWAFQSTIANNTVQPKFKVKQLCFVSSCERSVITNNVFVQKDSTELVEAYSANCIIRDNVFQGNTTPAVIDKAFVLDNVSNSMKDTPVGMYAVKLTVKSGAFTYEVLHGQQLIAGVINAAAGFNLQFRGKSYTDITVNLIPYTSWPWPNIDNWRQNKPIQSAEGFQVPVVLLKERTLVPIINAGDGEYIVSGFVF